jgi:hypothetical protein
MILTLESALGTVFKFYGVFWAVALIALFFGVGMLSKRR